MKILHIASGDLWAGAEKQLYTLLLALRRSPRIGVIAIILNPGTLANKIREAGINILVLDESRQNVFQLTKAVNRAVVEDPPDIIHTHRLKENIIGSLVATKHKIPSIRTQHGSNEHSFGAMNIRKRILHDIDYFSGRWLQKKIVAVSEPLAVELGGNYPPSKVCVIHNGLDLTLSFVGEDNKLQDPLTIGIVGRLAPVKRVDLFLEIAQSVLSQQPAAAKPVFRVIGDGPLRSEMERLADTLGIAGHVDFLGHIDNAEQAIAQLDVLVLCSDHEGLPMVALEAMKHKTLVLTHPMGGLPQLLGHGRCGYLVENQEVNPFVNAINTIIDDKDSMSRRTSLALQQLQDSYSAEAMTQGYIDVYRELVTVS
jgi:glycosyltransferase involved in cell wall biosynthesis